MRIKAPVAARDPRVIAAMLLAIAVLTPLSAVAAEPACLELRHYKKTSAEWPDEVEQPHGFYWVDAVNKCGRNLGHVYVVISFHDEQGQHLAETFWAFDFDAGTGAANRFTAPRMSRPYRSIRITKITYDLTDAICSTDRARCPTAARTEVKEKIVSR